MAVKTSSYELKIELLGRFKIYINDLQIPEGSFKSRKSISLLKFLAISPDYKSHRDHILESLWPAMDSFTGAAQLYKCVHYIRKAINVTFPSAQTEKLINYETEILSLNFDKITSDLKEFITFSREAIKLNTLENLQRAESYYKGEPLPSDIYENWTKDLRENLKLDYANLLVHLGEMYMENNYLADAADTFRKSISIEPLSERGHAGLIKTFALQGSRAQAIRQFNIYENLFANQLQLKPPEDLITLIDNIKENKITVTVKHSLAGSTLTIPALSLVGRDEEIDIYNSFLESKKEKILIIEGDSGIGKTKFVKEGVHISDSKGYQTFFSEVDEEEISIPFNHFLNIIKQAVVKSKEIIKYLPDEFSVLFSNNNTQKTIAPPDRLAASEYLFAEILEFFKVLSHQKPLLLIFDDFHYADNYTLKLFNYLNEKLKDEPVYFALTINPQFNQAIKKFIEEILKTSGARKILLKPLSYNNYLALTEHVLKYGELENSLSREIYSNTEGNPLFTIEVIEQFSKLKEIIYEDGFWISAKQKNLSYPNLYIPPSFQILFVKKWNSLSANAQNILNIASVAGQYMHLELLENVMNIPREHFLDSIDELVSTGMIKETGFVYRFSHSLFRHAVYQQISSAKLKDLHNKVASALETIYEIGAPVESIALHYKKAGNINNAVKYLMKSAASAELLYAHDDAIYKLSDALNLCGQLADAEILVEIHEQLGKTYKAIGNIESCKEHYLTAINLLEKNNLPEIDRTKYGKNLSKQVKERLTNLYKEMAISSILTTDMENAQKYLSYFAQTVGDDQLEKARYLIIESLYLWHYNELEKAVEKSKAALEIAEEKKAGLEINQSCEMLALSCFPLGKWQEGLKYELKRELAGWSPDIVVATDSHLCLWEYHLHGDEPYDSAIKFLNDVRSQAAQLGDLRCTAICHYALGSIAYLKGKFDEAIENLQSARTLQYKIKSPAGEAYTIARLAQLLTVRNNLDAGWKLINEGFNICKIISVKDHVMQRLLAVGLINRIKAKDQRNAKEMINNVNEIISGGKFCPSCSVQMFLSASYYYLNLDDPETALEYAGKAKVFIEMTGNKASEALYLKIKGEIFKHQNKFSDARDSFLNAAELFDNLGQIPDLRETQEELKNLTKNNTGYFDIVKS